MVGGGTKNSNHTRTLTARAIRTVDTKTKRLVNTIDLARQLATVQATPDAVWVSGVAVWRIDPLTGRVTATFPIQSRPLAVGAGSVWVLGADAAILRLILASVASRLGSPGRLAPLRSPSPEAPCGRAEVAWPRSRSSRSILSRTTSLP